MNKYLFAIVLALVAWQAFPASAEVPPYRHDHLDIYPAASVSTRGALKADGDLSDWKDAAFVRMMSDPALEDTYSLRLAAAYDAGGLWIAARFRDSTPLQNHVDPRLDPFKGWDGDALQLRLVTDAKIAQPIPKEKLNADAITHLTLWQFSDAKLSALDVRHGMDFHAAKTLTGAASGLFYRTVDGGYTLEARLPWALLKTAPPKAGQKWIMTVEPLWSGHNGQGHYFYDIVRAVGFQYGSPDGWGYGEFVKPADVHARFVAQAAHEKALFDSSEKAAFTIPVRYTNPKKGFVSLAICKADGEIVRTLLTKAARAAGPQVENWDGKDDDGNAVPPGNYVVKALVHNGIKPKYVASVMNSGHPGWGNSGGHYGWGGDHGVPIAAASDDQGHTFLLWTFNEGGDYLIEVDANGQKQWGDRISWGDFSGNATAVLYDEGKVYTAKDGLINGGKGGGLGGLFIYDAKTGRPAAFPGGAGKLEVTRWTTTNVVAGTANLRALAASPDQIFCALNVENKIVAFDKKTFKPARTYEVPAPWGIAFDRNRNLLYAVSGSTLAAIEVKSGAVKTFVSGLDEPQGLALDGAGNLYVSCRGAAMQVLVYAPEGKLLRKIGRTGGRPPIGKFDENGMYLPAGISVDARGQLWVTEEDATPKRQSVWNTKTGAFIKDFYGSAAYAPMMAPDVDQPDEVYLHNTRFKVDYATGQWRPDSTVYRRGFLPDGSRAPGDMIAGSEAGYGWMGGTFETAHINGKKFAYNGHGGVFAVEGDAFTPVYVVGGDTNGYFVWRDANGDGQVQKTENEALPYFDVTENISQFGGAFFPSGVFIKGRRIFKPAGLDANGVPLYPKPNDAPLILQGRGEMTKYANWLDVWPSLQSDWKEFYAIASLRNAGGGLDGGGEDAIYRFDRNGDIKWRYRRVAVFFGLKAPLAKIGDLYGALRIAGEAQTPTAGEVVSIGVYRGYFGFLNQDGLFIDQIGYDNGRGEAPNFDTFFIENFSGYFFRNPQNGKYYLFCGDVDGRILELQGWDTIQRFQGAPLHVTPSQFQRVLTAQNKTASENRQPLAIAQATPHLTGDLAGWDRAALAEIALNETDKARVRLAYDTKNLYAIFRVPDASPWKNGEGDWKFVFKGGDAVDIQLGTAWNGATKRVAQPGDVRLFLAPTPDGVGTRAIAMWPIAPAGVKAEAVLYKSPVAEERFAGVALLQNVETHVTKTANEYTLTAAIPWSELGMTAPARYAAFQGDVGVLLSDAGGTRTILRRYLFNPNTNIVNDIPSEVRVQSDRWGTLVFGGEASTPVTGGRASLQSKLEFSGTLGNSGGSGAALVHATWGRGAGGVAVDAQGRIFTGGGDRILALDSKGRQLFSLPLPDPKWVVGGPDFALAGKWLYFLAGEPVPYSGNYTLIWNPFTLVQPNLCRVERQPGAKPEVVVKSTDFPPWQPQWIRPEISLMASTQGEVFVAYLTSLNEPRNFSVFQIEGYKLAPLFKLASAGSRASIDEDGNFFIATDQIRKFDRLGQPVAGYTPWSLPSLGAVASSYSGAVMLTKNALWDMGNYGFIGRFTRDGKAAPGVVSQWQHNLQYVAQIAEAPDGELYFKSNGALYLAEVTEGRLKLLKRFGALPEVRSLVITDNGYVGTGSDRPGYWLWWDFDGAGAAAPVRSEYPGPIAQGFSEGATALALSVEPGYLPLDYQGDVHGFCLRRYAPEPFTQGTNQPSAIAGGRYDSPLVAIAHAGDNYFALAAKGMVLHISSDWKTLSAVNDLSAATSLSALGTNILLVATGYEIRAYQVAPDGALAEHWRFPIKNGNADDQLGDELYLAASGNRLLVSDTKRQRVRLYSFDKGIDTIPSFVSQFGETDRAGDDETHLNTPTLCALNGDRAAVYDAQNERVVKLRVR
jgi:sugar lactone lactonase YvrE